MESIVRGPVRIALGQIEVVPADVAGNLERAVVAAETAQRLGADVLVLPEALDVGWADPRAEDLAEPLDASGTLRQLREEAHRRSLYICAGLTERDDDAVYNTAVLIDPDGEVRLKHRKIHELDFAAEVYAAGRGLAVAETSLGTVGLLVCADSFAPGQVLTRGLAQMGAELILSPCAWAVPPDHDNAAEPYGDEWREAYGAVARDHGIWLIGVSSVGTIERGAWAGHRVIGASIVVGPDGEQACQAPYGRAAIEVVDIEPVHTARLTAPSEPPQLLDEHSP